MQTKLLIFILICSTTIVRSQNKDFYKGWAILNYNDFSFPLLNNYKQSEAKERVSGRYFPVKWFRSEGEVFACVTIGETVSINIDSILSEYIRIAKGKEEWELTWTETPEVHEGKLDFSNGCYHKSILLSFKNRRTSLHFFADKKYLLECTVRYTEGEEMYESYFVKKVTYLGKALFE